MLRSYYLNPKTMMEIHVFQSEELDASPKIAPFDWNPVGEEVAESPRRSALYSNNDRPKRMPLSHVDKSPEWEPNSVVSGLNWKQGWPKLAGSDKVRSVPIRSQSLNSTQGRLVMSTAAGIQSSIPTTYKSNYHNSSASHPPQRTKI